MREMTMKIEVDGMEQVEELLDRVEEVQEESTVFECSLGNDMSFKGTKSDFKVWLDGVEHIMRLANLWQRR